MDSKQLKKRNDGRSPDRLVYSTPRLRVFGPVGTLTQAGTAGNAEAVSMGMGMGGGSGGNPNRRA